jgi:hypothetical protein
LLGRVEKDGEVDREEMKEDRKKENKEKKRMYSMISSVVEK